MYINIVHIKDAYVKNAHFWNYNSLKCKRTLSIDDIKIDITSISACYSEHRIANYEANLKKSLIRYPSVPNQEKKKRK